MFARQIDVPAFQNAKDASLARCILIRLNHPSKSGMSQPEINWTVVSTRDSAGLELPAVLPRDNLTSKTQSPVSASKLSSMFCKSVSSFRLALTNSVRTSAMVLMVADDAAQ